MAKQSRLRKRRERHRFESFANHKGLHQLRDDFLNQKFLSFSVVGADLVFVNIK